MSNYLTVLKQHKRIVIFIAALLLLAFGYFSYQKIFTSENGIQYLTSNVKTGSISISVSGIGQVLASNEIELKSKTSGELTLFEVFTGQEITKDTLIAKIDDISARRNVRDATVELENAQLSLQKLMEPPTQLELERARNEITKAKNDLKQLKFDYDTEYQNTLDAITDLENDLPIKFAEAFNDITSIFINLPTVLADMDNVIDGHDYLATQANLTYYTNYLQNTKKIVAQREKVETNYRSARAIYDEALELYQTTSRNDTDKLEELTDKTYEATDEISQALKELNVFLTLVYDEKVQKGYTSSNILDQHISTTTDDMNMVNPHLTTIFDNVQAIDQIKKDIEDNKAELENITGKYELNKADLELSTREKENDLAELRGGADELDIKAQKIQIEQKQNSLADAQQDLKDYFIYMPFDGVISDVQAAKGDLVSSSTVLATAISNNKMAEITLNEIDVVKVKMGQKAILTFDALDDFTITGEVIEIDTVGTVEQGVVNYNVKISFDIDDERIKPGMSVNANLIAESRQNTLLVPNSAVKTQGGANYVEVLVNGNPVIKTVEIGIANDTTTEILSGLDGTEDVITNTFNQNSSSSSSTTTSNGGPPGGVMRMIR